jgi:hypothetical protein
MLRGLLNYLSLRRMRRSVTDIEPKAQIGAATGFFVANYSQLTGGVWWVVFVGAWLAAAYVLKRIAFRGAPPNIEFLC